MADSNLKSIGFGRLAAPVAIGIVMVLNSFDLSVKEEDVVKIIEYVFLLWGAIMPIWSKFKEGKSK